MYYWLVGARELNLRGVCSEEVEGGEVVVGKGGFRRTGTASPGRTHRRTSRSHSWGREDVPRHAGKATVMMKFDYVDTGWLGSSRVAYFHG